MCHAAREPSDTLQPLRLLKLLFQGPALGDIACDSLDGHQAAVGIPDEHVLLLNPDHSPVLVEPAQGDGASVRMVPAQHGFE